MSYLNACPSNASMSSSSFSNCIHPTADLEWRHTSDFLIVVTEKLPFRPKEPFPNADDCFAAPKGVHNWSIAMYPTDRTESPSNYPISRSRWPKQLVILPHEQLHSRSDWKSSVYHHPWKNLFSCTQTPGSQPWNPQTWPMDPLRKAVSFRASSELNEPDIDSRFVPSISDEEHRVRWCSGRNLERAKNPCLARREGDRDGYAPEKRWSRSTVGRKRKYWDWFSGTRDRGSTLGTQRVPTMWLLLLPRLRPPPRPPSSTTVSSSTSSAGGDRFPLDALRTTLRYTFLRAARVVSSPTALAGSRTPFRGMGNPLVFACHRRRSVNPITLARQSRAARAISLGLLRIDLRFADLREAPASLTREVKRWEKWYRGYWEAANDRGNRFRRRRVLESRKRVDSVTSVISSLTQSLSRREVMRKESTLTVVAWIDTT